MGAVSVSLMALALVVLDIVDYSLRQWFADHAFTTAVLGGVLVLAMTVLIVDRVVNLRQLQDRSGAIAAQAAILMSQARRTSSAVSSMLDGSGDRDAAADEVRTYMMMLQISAPVLIDARLSRTFLEAAQQFGGDLARALVITVRKSAATDAVAGRLDQDVQALRAASTPCCRSSTSSS